MITEVQKQNLSILSDALFSAGALTAIKESEVEAIIREACAQAVFPLVAGKIPKLSEPLKMQMNAAVMQNFKITYEHRRLHELLTDSKIPYVILKGCASASWYSDPILRAMGDVDILVNECDYERAGELLESNGYAREEDHGGVHTAFMHNGTICELHRSINGIPGCACGERVRGYLADIIDTAVDGETPCGAVRIPNAFHHGLVMLLHTASHLTAEGIGLRHLCDWAVFANKVDVAQWQAELQSCGLWEFARMLTLLSVKYLGMPEKPWAGEADAEVLAGLMDDIFTGGNFGHKDEDRPQQIKYISNRGEKTVDSKGVIRQAWDTIGKKAAAEDKTRFGVLLSYGAMVLRGQRKPDSGKMISEANQRKKLYAELHLFEVSAEKKSTPNG